MAGGEGRKMKRLAVCTCAGIFVYTGFVKIMDPPGFLRQIETYRFFPYHLALLIAYFMPVLELTTGLALLWPRTTQGAWLILTSLIASFILLAAISYFRGLDIVCGCFTTEGMEPSSYAWIFTRDFVILALLLFLRLKRSAKPKSKSGEKDEMFPISHAGVS
jgi:uncharacterized membrane protein YphA (DoxX/SURF4 family)